MKINCAKLEKDFVFSGGELQVKVPDNLAWDLIRVQTRLTSSDEIMKALLVANAISHKYPDAYIILEAFYLPYARQDRVCLDGEAYSRQVIVDLLQNSAYNEVLIADVHSKGEELPNKFTEYSQSEILKDNPQILEGIDFLVAPDAGAAWKTEQIANKFGLPVIYCEKTRDVETGALSKPILILNDPKLIENKNLLIVDDICDGGYTFIQLAEKLKELNPAEINLYITHGIFSKGTYPLWQVGFNRIITTDSLVREGVNYKDIEVIEL